MICRRRVGQFKDRRGVSGANFGYLWSWVEPPESPLCLACHLLWHIPLARSRAPPGPQAAARTRRLAEYICTAGATRRRGGLRYFVRAVSIAVPEIFMPAEGPPPSAVGRSVWLAARRPRLRIDRTDRLDMFNSIRRQGEGLSDQGGDWGAMGVRRAAPVAESALAGSSEADSIGG